MVSFQRGARLAPRHKLLGLAPFRAAFVPPDEFAWVPAKLDPWGNATWGDCVSAEEAFAKACSSPEIFIDSGTVVAWAKKRGFLNGANLIEVMDAMRSDGFVVGAQQYDDGPHTGVDWSNEPLLQAAIASGPVKIAIDADALPSDAGNKQGWHSFGHWGTFPSTDHCVALCGYGPCGWLFSQLGVLLPPGVSPTKRAYLLYTWATIGVVDHDWLMGTCQEAYLRNPTTVGVPPLVPPTPPGPPPMPPPNPPSPPPPLPVNVRQIVDTMFADLEAHARRPGVRAALAVAQALADQWLAGHGY